MSAKKQISKILLVDDDPSVRRICRIVLERAGFGVIESDSGHTAHTLWQMHGHGIDLLVTDYEMPGLTGLQLSVLLRNAKPSLKVLLISGFIQDSIPSSIAFLPKPFSSVDLTEAVHRCLAS